jgi:hypothetical protein
VADPITQLLLGAPRTAVSWSREPVAVWLDGPSVVRRLEVWAAVGMVMSTGIASEEDALSLLRAYAFSHEVTLDELAQLLISHRLKAATLRG